VTCIQVTLILSLTILSMDFLKLQHTLVWWVISAFLHEFILFCHNALALPIYAIIVADYVLFSY
jgi:hypothetical protein